MLGFKIIKESEYKRLVNYAERSSEEVAAVRNELKMAQEDLGCLRNLLNNELNKLVEVRQQLKNLKFTDIFQLVIDKKCARCKKEQADCVKYSVGEHTVCIRKISEIL